MSTVNASDTGHCFLGKEVSVADIRTELQGLWAADGAGTRASLINFAIYNEAENTLEPNSRLLASITREHACRALLINNVQSCTPGEEPVRAWITAHCQLRGGSKSVCSEQLSFLLQCGGTRHVRNIVFAHLDSDLPLVFWWQGELNEHFEDRLYSVIDRLIIDSADWNDPLDGFKRLNDALQDTSSRFCINDLAWSRTEKLRRALSDCFEDRAALAQLSELSCISIVHGPHGRIPATLLAAWIAQQTNLVPTGPRTLVSAAGRNVQLELRTEDSASTVGCLTLSSAGGRFTFERDVGFPFIRSRIEIGGRINEQLIPAPRDRRSTLVSDQLGHAGSMHSCFPNMSLLEPLLGNLNPMP